MEGQARHKPGVFKQQNKTHKTGRHRSKGEIHKTNKGKVGVKLLTKGSKNKSHSRDDRKNRLSQIRKNKREEILNKKRSIGSLSGAPHLVVRPRRRRRILN
jgi:pre-rRNA-processing protein TSR1